MDGDLLAVMDAAALRRPVIVGWSLGGLIAGIFIGNYGGAKVAGVNLVNGVTRLAPNYVSALAVTLAGKLQVSDLRTRTRASHDFLRACFATLPDTDDLAEMLVVNGMSPRAVHQGLGGLSLDGLDAAWAAVDRVLLSYGEEDQLLHPAAMTQQVLAHNKDARVSLYSGIGHAPMWEAPGRFNAELAAFVAGNVAC